MQVRAALLQQFLEGLGLGNGAGEAVEHDALLAGGLSVEHVIEYVDHKPVGNQLSLRDIFVGGLAELCAALYVVAQQFTCRDVIEAILVDEPGALGALAAAGRPE